MAKKKDTKSFALWQELFSQHLSPFMQQQGFQYRRGDKSFVYDEGDYHCQFDCSADIDTRYDQGVLELGVLAGFKSLAAAWRRMPHADRHGSLPIIGFGGWITELPPPDDLFYYYDPSCRAELIPKVMERVRNQVIPFFKEFRDPLHLIDVWRRRGHPFARPEGHELKLAGALLFVAKDAKGAAEALRPAIERAKTDQRNARNAEEVARFREEEACLMDAIKFIEGHGGCACQ